MQNVATSSFCVCPRSNSIYRVA